jgi:anti-sigma regulatory factor (Ser/Thr protein kinase)
VERTLTVRGAGDAARARHFVVDTCVETGLLAVCDDAALLASEIVTNAVRHAGADLAVTVTVRGDDGQLVVEVTDCSPQPPTLGDADPLAESGRGMYLVEAIADEWGVRRHPQGKTVWFRL